MPGINQLIHSFPSCCADRAFVHKSTFERLCRIYRPLIMLLLSVVWSGIYVNTGAIKTGTVRQVGLLISILKSNTPH